MKVIDACVSLFCRFLFLFILPTHLEGTKRWVGEGEPIISIAMIVGGGEGEKKINKKKWPQDTRVNRSNVLSSGVGGVATFPLMRGVSWILFRCRWGIKINWN